MITLLELFEVTTHSMKDMNTGEKIDDDFIINHPDLKIKRIGFDYHSFNFTVEFEKEPEDEE